MMTIDVDAVLLDRVFQPICDGVGERIGCFGLARFALAGVALLQTVALSQAISVGPEAGALGLTVAASVLQYWAVSQVARQIRRAERRTRPGMMNVARITLRPFRMVWLLVAAASACLLSGMHGGAASVCPAAANGMWVATVYLMSCVARSPSARVRSRMVAQGAC